MLLPRGKGKAPQSKAWGSQVVARRRAVRRSAHRPKAPRTAKLGPLFHAGAKDCTKKQKKKSLDPSFMPQQNPHAVLHRAERCVARCDAQATSREQKAKAHLANSGPSTFKSFQLDSGSSMLILWNDAESAVNAVITYTCSHSCVPWDYTITRVLIWSKRPHDRVKGKPKAHRRTGYCARLTWACPPHYVGLLVYGGTSKSWVMSAIPGRNTIISVDYSTAGL